MGNAGGKSDFEYSMTNYAFRYIAEENLISDENLAHLERVFTAPINDAFDLTNNESDDTVTPGLDE